MGAMGNLDLETWNFEQFYYRDVLFYGYRFREPIYTFLYAHN